MSTEEWVVVDQVAGPLQGEILRGLLEAQGVEAELSQESAGQYGFAVNIGELGRVEILVPVEQVEQARKVLEDYYAGAFADTPPFTPSLPSEDEEESGDGQNQPE